MQRLATIVIALVLLSCHALYALDVVEEEVRIPMKFKHLFGTNMGKRGRWEKGTLVKY
jgi:hypothetical protein